MSKTTEMIKRLRHCGLSGSEIARRAGVSQSRISRWERGAVPAAADDVWRLQELERSLEPHAPAEVKPEPIWGRPLGEGA